MQHLLSRGASARRYIGVAIAVASVSLPAGLAAAGTEPAPPSSDAMSYCTAHLALETAMSSGDPAMIEPAVAAVTEAAPADIAEAVAAAIANAPMDGPPTPEFNAAYGEMIDYVKANCGFAAVEVLATEYAFGGLPEELASGPTVVSLTNNGEEMHEIILVRKNDGVTASAEELLALPEDEALAQVQMVGMAFAAPGETGHTVADLAPGDYIAVCFIPEGTTPEVLEQMMAAESGGPTGATGPEGSAPMGSEPPPHFVHGMVQEFTVTGDTIEVSATAVMEAPATTG
jgi:hypothetical protein